AGQNLEHFGLQDRDLIHDESM
ncbi:MAG: hypothetical protein HW391_1236, partial [Chloroflexi bacterium]|nr:hypothetical protein [Chloroflexota bacterium]